MLSIFLQCIRWLIRYFARIAQLSVFHEKLTTVVGTIGPKSIAQYWLHEKKAPPNGEIHWPPPSCTTVTGQYFFDWWYIQYLKTDLHSMIIRF